LPQRQSDYRRLEITGINLTLLKLPFRHGF